ncbi:MAG: HEPN domain-containing protein [Oscillospiraceae bacterium]|nr:HEPN domain-containing protein [Oscillospiraceae bacterium]
MDGSVTDLSKYRLETAKDDLATAKKNFEDARYRASVNRSYYAIFHALRALTALDQFDSGKHSGIIAYVNQHYVKEGIFDKSFSKLIDSAYRLREKADYEDFYIVAIEDARKQIEKAETVIEAVEKYVQARWDA